MPSNTFADLPMTEKPKLSVRDLNTEGIYRDRRRTDREIDASQCIWILATNLGQNEISQFHAKNIAKRKDEDVTGVSIETLKQTLAKTFITSFSVSTETEYTLFR